MGLSLSLPKSFETGDRLKVNKLFDEYLTANDGMKEVLESLSIPFCTASSAPSVKIERTLILTLLAWLNFSMGIFSVPMKWVLGSSSLYAAQAMGVEPDECCVVEDSELGLQAANRAKMKSIYYVPRSDETKPAWFRSNWPYV